MSSNDYLTYYEYMGTIKPSHKSLNDVVDIKNTDNLTFSKRIFFDHNTSSIISFDDKNEKEEKGKNEKEEKGENEKEEKGENDNKEYTKDSIVNSVISKFISRSVVGQEKYGTTLDRTDLSLHDWIIHAQEEHMDAILYLEKIKKLIVNTK